MESLCLYLFEFVQFGDVCGAGQAHVDEAEQLQVGELFCDSFDLPLTGATVVQDQLLDLRTDRDTKLQPSFHLDLKQRAATLREVSK